ncbi:MAG: penicillin acylase family protein [Gemmatimonadales bacterium]
MKRTATRIAALAATAAGLATATAVAQPEIIRTEHGVPHVYAANFREAGYGLAWVQMEDYGPRVADGLVVGRGGLGRLYGRDSMETDFTRRAVHGFAAERWLTLKVRTREVYQGFAEGVNEYVRRHPDRFPVGTPTDFTGWDVLAREIGTPAIGAARWLVARETGQRAPTPRNDVDVDGPDDGSNAWALAPSRTRSRHAILLRNPHLDWGAGYYEAHVVVPGQLDFYGDYRIGGPFGVIGGFNRDLGWATTNNSVDNDEVYRVRVAPGTVDAILLDGRPVPLTRRAITVDYRAGDGWSTETREVWDSPIGPVVERTDSVVYILRDAAAGEPRGGEQFLAMMMAGSYDEWRAALAMQARSSSNLTYADRAGNVFYIWNGTLPSLPHPPTGDTASTPVARTDEVWSQLVPLDSMPQVRNPPGGYVQNENSSPHFTNLNAVLDPASLPPNAEAPSLSLRSQLSLELIGKPGPRLSLEDVIRLKHSYRMLLADRVKADLLAAAAATPSGSSAEGAEILRAWDNTAAPEARGAVLFEMWWRLYAARLAEPFAVPWSFAEPTTTPRGLADPARAAAALAQAVDSVRRRFGAADVPWGEVHRVRFGSVDAPVGGCHGNLGCFRVLWFRDEPDGKWAVQGGDGWILAVEFGPVPRAYSVLAYGESNDPAARWHDDQAAMFARGELKPVAYTRADVERVAIARYRAGSGAP